MITVTFKILFDFVRYCIQELKNATAEEGE